MLSQSTRKERKDNLYLQKTFVILFLGKGTFVDLFHFKILFACNSIAQSTFQEYDITLIVMIQKLVNNSTLPCNSKKLAD